jgi:8-oxo-dGTP pyrophosphatase MutT (NUDIX family)
MLKFLDMNELRPKKKVQVVILFQDEVLLLKLSEKRGGFWQNVTGGVDKGEDFLEAAIRELFEETGIKAIVEELPYEFNFDDRFGYHVTERAFCCRLLKKINPVLSDEHQDFKWQKLSETSVKDFKYPTNYKPLEIIKKR